MGGSNYQPSILISHHFFIFLLLVPFLSSFLFSLSYFPSPFHFYFVFSLHFKVLPDRYDGKDEACQYNRSSVAVRVAGGLEISTDETDMAKVGPGDGWLALTAHLQWLLKNGPISVGLNANAMQFYKGGVSHPWKFLCSPDGQWSSLYSNFIIGGNAGIDHGVLIVGFGEHEYPLFHKKMPYWTIKNSWGTGWGEQVCRCTCKECWR
jgi:hypothetical protein